MDGFLLVDKPVGWTSHDVVAKARSVLKAKAGQKVKVGHTGTLDPAASGLLVLVIGQYTKRAQEFSKLDKTYQAEVTLGATSSTGDAEGEIALKSSHRPTEAQVKQALNKFIGQISRTPPAFSAIKVDGQRAYRLARAGKTFQLEARQVTVYRLEVTEYKYPKLSFITEVSSGTYIRSLAEDIGQALGTGAYMSALRRLKVGKFGVDEANSIEDLTKDSFYPKILTK